MPRLFTALEIPASVTMRLAMVQGGLPGARWVEQADFHLTLCFVGDVDGNEARELSRALERVKTGPFILKLSGLNTFGNNEPHSLYAGAQRSEPLKQLQREQARICQQLGFNADRRKFTPHVTIARVRRAEQAHIARYLSHHGAFESQDFKVDRFVLYSSRDSTGGGPYVKEDTYHLLEKDHVATHQAV